MLMIDRHPGQACQARRARKCRLEVRDRKVRLFGIDSATQCFDLCRHFTSRELDGPRSRLEQIKLSARVTKLDSGHSHQFRTLSNRPSPYGLDEEIVSVTTEANRVTS